ncbi:hypothetical protein RUM43_001631 [Polyplax serrata]|uniref:Ammonium transporter AmtB-like domain-containing protein n=1 Tax=Polyplax serrata TaxID=468196 RepID=A0AAN8XR23_POLSC
MASIKSRKIAIVSILCLQAILIVLFSIFVKYDGSADPLPTQPTKINETTLDAQYPMFQDMHVMIFVGFGFIMTFLRKYAFSALGLTFFISSLVIQWGLLCHGFSKLNAEDGLIHLSLVSLINADIMAAVVLISFGAIIGKTSPIQLIIMAFLETIFFAFNEYIGVEVLQASDAGGSVYVHAFAAYFGLAVSLALYRGVATEDDSHTLESSSYQSDITAMIGSLFLWMFWPSFNAALVFGDERHRTFLNTYLALTASCLTAFATSAMLNKNTKFDMVHVQNATLAGGVCVGTSVNLMIQPYGALLIGSLAGILTTLGYQFLQGIILKKLRIHDTCGVNNLHGVPGVVGGIIGAIMAGMADTNTYGKRLYQIFPAMGPSMNRTAAQQAGYQLIAILVTLLVSIVSGLITGLFIRNFRRVERTFDDGILWNLPEEEIQPTPRTIDGKKI